MAEESRSPAGETDQPDDYDALGMSQRAQDTSKIGPSMEGHIGRCAVNAFHPVNNPEGFVPFGLAENKLAVQVLLPKLEEIARTPEETWINFYSDFTGDRNLKIALKKFLEHNFPVYEELELDNMFVTNGATSALETFAFVLADPGEYIMVPRPYYFRMESDFKERALVNVLPVEQPDLTDSQGRYSLDVDVLEKAYLEAAKEGKVVRAIHITNPSNPTGDVYTAEELTSLLEFANRYKLHVIANELYGLSVFDDDVKFTSILSIPHPDPTRVHYLWSTSKDFGLSGYRVSMEYTRNPAVGSYLEQVGSYITTPGPIEIRLTRLFSDLDYFDNVFKPEMKKRMLARFQHVKDEIEACGGRVHTCPATFFRWLDLRAFLPSPDWEGERQLFNRFMQDRVFLVAGEFFHHMSPGWFRMVAASEDDIHYEGMKRLVSVLKAVASEKKQTQTQQEQ